MLRAVNYILMLAGLFGILLIAIPFALVLKEFNTIPAGQETNIDLSKYWPEASISIAVLFLIAGCGLVVLHHYLWNKFVKKDNKFEVPLKLISKYKYVSITMIIALLVVFSFFLIAWTLPGHPGLTNMTYAEFSNAFWTRKVLYITFVVLGALVVLVPIGISSYINLQVIYDQQKKIIDEGIETGEYDPVTRMPINDVKVEDSEFKVGEKKNTPKSNEEDDKKITSGFLN